MPDDKQQFRETQDRLEQARRCLYQLEARFGELQRQRERQVLEIAELGSPCGEQDEEYIERAFAEVHRLLEDLSVEVPSGNQDRLKTLHSTLNSAKIKLAERRGQMQRVLRDLENARGELARRRSEAEISEQVALLLQQTAEHARRQAKAQIEALVTATLRSVFGPDYGFSIELTERAGRPEAEFYVLSDFGGEKLATRLQDSRGGGIVDIVSLGLRMAMLETYRPKLEGALILDEPAKQVSDEFIPATAQLFQRVSEGFGRQVIMVTHDVHLAETARVAYQVVLHGERSVVTRTL